MLDNAARFPPRLDPQPAEILRPPVHIIAMGHNRRCALWSGEVDETGEALFCPPLDLLALPVPMPQTIFVSTGPDGERWRSTSSTIPVAAGSGVRTPVGSGRMCSRSTQRSAA